MIQTHLEDGMAVWVSVQAFEGALYNRSDYIKALQEQQGVQTKAMYLDFISLYFSDQGKISLLIQSLYEKQNPDSAGWSRILTFPLLYLTEIFVLFWWWW